jgi:hypothetical protein
MTQQEAIEKCKAHWEENVRLLKEHKGETYTLGIQEHRIYFDVDLNQTLSFSDDDCAFCIYTDNDLGCNNCPGVIANGFSCDGGGPWVIFRRIIESTPHVVTEDHIAAAQEVLDWVAKAEELLEED